MRNDDIAAQHPALYRCVWAAGRRVVAPTVCAPATLDPAPPPARHGRHARGRLARRAAGPAARTGPERASLNNCAMCRGRAPPLVPARRRVWREEPERFCLDGRYPVQDAWRQARRAWAGEPTCVRERGRAAHAHGRAPRALRLSKGWWHGLRDAGAARQAETWKPCSRARATANSCPRCGQSAAHVCLRVSSAVLHAPPCTNSCKHRHMQPPRHPDLLSQEGDTLLVVTHKSILRAMLCTALGLPPARFRCGGRASRARPPQATGGGGGELPKPGCGPVGGAHDPAPHPFPPCRRRGAAGRLTSVMGQSACCARTGGASTSPRSTSRATWRSRACATARPATTTTTASCTTSLTSDKAGSPTVPRLAQSPACRCMPPHAPARPRATATFLQAHTRLSSRLSEGVAVACPRALCAGTTCHDCIKSPCAHGPVAALSSHMPGLQAYFEVARSCREDATAGPAGPAALCVAARSAWSACKRSAAGIGQPAQ